MIPLRRSASFTPKGRANPLVQRVCRCARARQALSVAGGGLSESAVPPLPGARARLLTGALGRSEREALPILVVAVYAVLLCARLPELVAQDTWLALVAGREVVQHGIPSNDMLTIWTAGEPWVDQQWLAQLGIYGAVAAGGIRLALLLHVGFLVGTIALVLAAARRFGASPRAVALGGALCLLGAAEAAVLRGQTLALPLFALLLWLLLADARAPSSRILLALPLLALWTNLHGSAVLAAVLVMLWGLDSLRRRPGVALLLLIGTPGALVASPYGFALLGYYERTIGNRTFSEFVTEWAPPTFPGDWRVFVLAAVALWLASRHAALLTRYEKLVFLVLVLAALSANRNAVWLALFCGIVLPRLIEAEWPPMSYPSSRRLAVVTWAAVGVALLALGVSAFGRQSTWYERGYPEGAAGLIGDRLEHDPSARVFSSERYADWLLWKLPDAKGRVAFDARFELLSEAQHVQLSEFTNAAEGWQSLLRGYSVVVLEPGKHARNEQALLSSGSARRAYAGEEISVLLLESGSP